MQLSALIFVLLAVVVVHGGVTTPSVRPARAIANPDGTTARSIVIPDGTTARSIVIPDGTTARSIVIPDGTTARSIANPDGTTARSIVDAETMSGKHNHTHATHLTHGPHEGHLHTMVMDQKVVGPKDVKGEFPGPVDEKNIDKLSSI